MAVHGLELRIGEVLGDYKILGVLGSGALGKVYQVRNTATHCTEVMQVLPTSLSAQQSFLDRLVLSAWGPASLVHPNIVRLNTIQKIQGQTVMVSDFVQGCTFEALLDSGIPLEEALYYTSQALCGLAHGHIMGSVHGDIRPRNLMLTPEGTVKLMNFGIARPPADPALAPGTTAQAIYYRAPEVARGFEPDVRSDFYALGVVLYQLLTGKLPFNGGSEKAIVAAHAKGSPRRPRHINRAIPPHVNAVVLKALAKNPDQRFQTAAEFQNALARVAPRLAAGSSNAAMSDRPAGQPLRGRRISYINLNVLVVVGLACILLKWELPKYRHAAVATPLAHDQNSSSRVQFSERVPSRAERRSFRAGASLQKLSARGPQPAGTPADTAPEGVSPESLKARLTVLTARWDAAAVLLEARQRRGALPPDVQAARQRVQAGLRQAALLLDHNDTAGAFSKLDEAQVALMQIESFTGANPARERMTANAE